MPRLIALVGGKTITLTRLTTLTLYQITSKIKSKDVGTIT